ncbi:preprotein translocase subunit SecA [Candidatus Kaiserbacteria bacterium CG_4_9_14_0_2_um_filter_41_32]|uniref:Protein translocase subunit SecA n=1 Tax=Candidatus Kaiserbacteria bacterium CG_4_9_14_0_2_um_filter_41_32 TaxID=1974601 RepID=A0A2M8FE30_9BACT|nr:MAG: preprotein translocase subunit SecA [Candidatus Kaiserbacteria bacterium CG_4_9_14_0_2_um_filter_41_32]
MSFLDRFFGPSYDKELQAISPLVTAINNKEESISALSTVELIAYTEKLKNRVALGEKLEEVLVEAFALVRESSKRTLGQRHFDVQLLGGILLHQGKITEMRTGEGKTLVGTLPAYLNALTGKGVHVVTVNDYLARRDGVWMGQIYVGLGLSVGIINSDGSYLYDTNHTDKDAERDAHGSFKVVHDFLRPCSRKEAYAADITYGTNSEFGFDYLRDNIEFEVANLRQRGHAYAIVDEIDSILIDEARTPLIISAPAEDSENLYQIFANIARNLEPITHYEVDEKLKSASLTDAGVEAAEKMLGVDNIYTDKGIKYVHHLETAVRAKALYTRDKEYVVRDGEAVIVDEFTGRLQPGRRWSDGLHQAVEAKEGVAIQRESRTYASITYQNYFRMYEKLSGMTGTALTSNEEFYTVYKLEVTPVPTHLPVRRIDHNDLIFQNEAGKFTAIIARVKQIHETGQPILIGTASIESNERLSIALSGAGIPHEVLNAKNHEREGEIIAAAGKRGGVTLATNMAGRGVDIKLGGPDASLEEHEAVRELGGLFVLGTERHEARRIDNQLRGRAGRQGDAGETQFYVSMEDSLMRVFGGERVKNLMGTFGIPADQPIEMKLISKQLESAQTRIEGFHFDSRKQVLAYDDILNQQRMIAYARRHKLLEGDKAEVLAVLEEVEELDSNIASVVQAKKQEFGDTEFMLLFQRLALQMFDTLWVEHLEVMSYTRSSVNLRAYGQRDPLVEYRKEGTQLFKQMQQAVLTRIAEILPRVQPAVIEREDTEHKKQATAALLASQMDAKATSGGNSQRVSENIPGRNDLITITNGRETKQLKYKKAEEFLENGWKIQ